MPHRKDWAKTLIDRVHDHAPIEFTATYLITKYGLCVEKTVDHLLEKEGLDTRDFCVLWLLNHNGKLSQQSLADSVVVNRNAMVKIVDHLEQSKLVTRVKNLENRRENLIQITPSGEKKLAVLYQIIAKELVSVMYEGFTKKEKEQLKLLLMRVFENLAANFLHKDRHDTSI